MPRPIRPRFAILFSLGEFSFHGPMVYHGVRAARAFARRAVDGGLVDGAKVVRVGRG